MHPKLVHDTAILQLNGLDWYVTGTLGLFGDVSNRTYRDEVNWSIPTDGELRSFRQAQHGSSRVSKRSTMVRRGVLVHANANLSSSSANPDGRVQCPDREPGGNRDGNQ
jgi:hypothetical protein